MSCWHLWRMFTKPFRGSGTLHFGWEALWFSLYQTSPRHTEMSRWKPRWCVRWRRRLHNRESPDETSHKGDTHAHSYTHSPSLMVTHFRWLITEGFPRTRTVTTRQLSHLQNSVLCKLSRFFHQPLCLLHKNVWCDGETLFNLSASTFSIFLLILFQCESCVS